jgi:putrescine aminotransferase
MSLNRQLIKKYKEVNLGEVSLPVCFHRASGSMLYDYDGNSFLDFTSGYGVTSSGWLRQEIATAIQNQLQRSAYAPPWLPTQEAIELSELLLAITPPNLVKCARAIGGADANEIIFKAVYGCSGKKGIVSFRRSYHGGTHFALNISDAETFRLPQLPAGSEFHFVDPPYCYRCPHDKTPDTCNLECTAVIERIFAAEKDIGSFFMEPVIGSGGVIIPPQKYFQRIRELCDEYKVFLIFDEVLTGFGRLGSLTASELFGIRPDAISFAKGMSAGYTAIGAAVMNAELADGIKKYEDVSASFAWTPLACCIAKTNIELIIKDELPANANLQGSLLLELTSKLFQQYLPCHTGDIRGLGLMLGIELVTDKITKTPDKKLVQKFIIASLRQGLMVCCSWDFQSIILMPPLNISSAEIEEGVKRMESTLQLISRS